MERCNSYQSFVVKTFWFFFYWLKGLENQYFINKDHFSMHKNAFQHSTFVAKMWDSRLMRLISPLLSYRKEGRLNTGNKGGRLSGDNLRQGRDRKRRVEKLYKNFLQLSLTISLRQIYLSSTKNTFYHHESVLFYPSGGYRNAFCEPLGSYRDLLFHLALLSF